MEAQVAVIGSGPAGVAAARPLIEAGLNVTMIEAGEWSEPDLIARPWIDFRTQEKDQWARLAGAPAEAANATRRSAKFSVPWVADIANGAEKRLRFAADNFEGMPFAAVGGLSTAWGSGLAMFDARDLAGWPVSPEELSESYAAVADLIGASGPWPKGHGAPPASLAPHPGLHPTAQRLLARAKPRQGFEIDEGLHAVLGAGRDGRGGCDLSGACLFGCSRRSIWSAAYEVRALQAGPRFTLRSNLRIDAMTREGEGWRLTGHDGSVVRARRVICAGGAIGSPRLVLPLSGRNGAPVRLLSSPVGAFALFVPGRLGAAWEKRFFGLAQVQVRQEIDDAGDYVYGGVFCGEGIPLRFLVSMAPVKPRLAMRIFRDLVPACLFGNIFFDGRHSDHTLSLTADGGVSVKGGHAASLDTAVGAAASRLRRSFGKLGAIMLPGKPVLAAPGADLHFAGSLPMSRTPEPGRTDRWGAPYGVADLVVVDGSVLPSLPAKGHTFTIMANARRIARHWAREWTTVAAAAS